MNNQQLEIYSYYRLITFCPAGASYACETPQLKLKCSKPARQFGEFNATAPEIFAVEGGELVTWFEREN